MTVQEARAIARYPLAINVTKGRLELAVQTLAEVLDEIEQYCADPEPGMTVLDILSRSLNWASSNLPR